MREKEKMNEFVFKINVSKILIVSILKIFLVYCQVSGRFR